MDRNKPLIEIGSGLGSLSYYLSRYIDKPSIFFEIDQRLAEITVKFIEKPDILINSDALLHEWRLNQLVSNTPYSITSKLLVKLARSNYVERAVLVLQKDVVDRIIAEPGSREYGRLSILIKILFNIEKGPVYPPDSFFPKPEVSSQLIVLHRKRSYDELIMVLEEITRKIFSFRRKKALKILSRQLGVDKDFLEKIGVSSDKRIYELDEAVLLRLAEYLRNMY